MRYLPHTQEDIKEMLDVVGVSSLDDLFDTIPASCRRTSPLNIPGPFGEWELTRHMEGLAAKGGNDWNVFVGGGSQPHHIPTLVPYLSSRQEFLTSYTPYQPEMSQGTLQAIFEFQTLISRMVGVEITNASMYDGSTAMAEGALMAQRVTKRSTLVISEAVHPHWREVLNTYLGPREDVELITLPLLPDGRTNLAALAQAKEPAALIMQSPNFLGVIEDVAAAADAIHKAGGLLVSGFSEAFALGLIKSPGSQGADVVYGEGQSLGLSQGFGGPTLGLLSCNMEHVRSFPGRLAGMTKDIEGKRGFVLTLSTREQHIRRSRAVSNICSNAGHCALTAAVFMAAIGGTGFRAMAQVNLDLAEYMKKGLIDAGFKAMGDAPTFNEFALKAPAHFREKHEKLKAKKILAGLPLAEWYPGLADCWLFGVTETKTRADIDAFLSEVRQ